MTVQILNDIYAFIAETCGADDQETVMYKAGQFCEYGLDDGEGWIPLEWEQVADKIQEYLKARNYDGTYLYVCPDNAYVCIEDPKDCKDSLDLFDEYESGLMVAID